MKRSTESPNVGCLVHDFFCGRLIQQQNASVHTIAAYRDTFRLLFRYLRHRRHKEPSDVTIADLDSPTVLAFLNDLERHRSNTIRTRNARLAALRSFMKYAGACDPTALPIVQRVLAIPMKRFNRPLLGYLTREEITAIVQAPNQQTWSGRRDRALLTLLYNTGIRVSEVVGLSRADAQLNRTCAVQVCGKGRKQRQIPLWKTTAALLTAWLKEIEPGPQTPLFPNRHGRMMSRSGVERRLQQAVVAATEHCPSLRDRRVSPHTLRHTTAMHLLQAGVEMTVIALWLGHESPKTTHHYVEADLAMKQRALESMNGLPVGKGRYRAKDDLLEFLDGL
jgi:site-specific recombinase XerD